MYPVFDDGEECLQAIDVNVPWVATPTPQSEISEVIYVPKQER
jgi:hypothetical protein